MKEAPDKRSNGATGPDIDDRNEVSEYHRGTGPNNGPVDTGSTVGPNTDPELQPTQAFFTDYQKAVPERYRLIEMIGRGGMAEVFLARDTRLNRRVAIKFLSSEFRRDPDRTRRFSQEARAASALNHPNILIVHDINEHEGVQFIVSEYVEGETLGSRIRRGRIPLLEAVNIAIQVASALAASHNAGIVHRDVKPDNIMLRADGSAKVLDFGLAKETEQLFSNDSDIDAKTLDQVSTSPGLVLGTPQYMSPEQTRGAELDARTDVFSLGNIIFEMVTGHLPFPGQSLADIIAAIISREPRRLEEYLVDPPLKLISIVDKALRKDKQERYSKMEHFLADLKSLQQDLVAHPYQGAVETGQVEARDTRHKTIQSILAGKSVYREAIVVLLAVAGLVALSVWWYSRKSTDGQSVIAGSKGTMPVTSWSSTAGESAGAASFSQDMRMVAFAATKSDATEIWTKPIGGGDPIQVTKNGFYNQYPVWSPNGQEIAFFSSRGESRGIWRARFTGGDQVQVASGIGRTARPVKWMDGKIYYQDESELYSADDTTGKIAQITAFGAAGLTPWRIDISDDGSSIAYSIKEGEVWKLKVQRTDSGSSDEIAESNRQIDHLTWQPDGKSVIFSNSVDGVYQIFEKTVGTGGTPAQLSTGDHDLFVKDVSPDGTKILYGSVSETSDLWMVGTNEPKESPVANDVANEFWGDFSPDGKSIAFQSVTQTERPFGGSINVLNKAGGSSPIVVSKEGFSPEWSPNGQWIAFFRRSGSGMELWRVRPTGDDALKLADGNVNPPGYTPTPYLKIGTNHLSWSPDSSLVAYSERTDGILNLWLAAVDGSRNEQLTRNNDKNESYCCPIWTPDGKSIIFVSGNDGTAEQKKSAYRIWLYQLGNSQQRLLYESPDRFRLLGLDGGARGAIVARKADPADLSLTPESTNIFSVSLHSGAASKVNTLGYSYFHNIHVSPDGTSIAFVSRRDNTTTLWTVPVSGGTPRKVLGENDPKVLISSLAWSPDGTSIVFGKQTRTNLLSMLTR